MEHDLNAFGDKVAGEDGDADAQVDVHAVAQLPGGPQPDELPGQARQGQRRPAGLGGDTRLVFSPLDDFRGLDDLGDEHAGDVDPVWVQLSQLDRLFDLEDCLLGRLGHPDVAVTGPEPACDVAPSVRPPRHREGEVDMQGFFEDVGLAVEGPPFLSFVEGGAFRRFPVESTDSRAAGPHPLLEDAGRDDLDLKGAPIQQLRDEWSRFGPPSVDAEG